MNDVSEIQIFFCCCCSPISILPESLRWEFTVGKPSHALYHIDKAARKNGVKIANDTIESFLVQTKRVIIIIITKINLTISIINKLITIYIIV